MFSLSLLLLASRKGGYFFLFGVLELYKYFYTSELFNIMFYLTERQKAISKAIEKYIIKNRLEIKAIAILLRDCDDILKYIRRMNKAHEETGKSKLRFGCLESIAS